MSIYEPSEDSFFISEILRKQIPKILKKNINLKFLEIGAGSGFNLKTTESLGIKKQNIFSCDINTDAVKQCKSLGFRCIKSDLFSKITGKYHIIIFNPPYLPDDRFDKEKDTSGGKNGDEIILKFLKQAKNYLEQDGRIFLLMSSFTPMKRIKKEFGNYQVKLIGKEKLFFEELFVWGLK